MNDEKGMRVLTSLVALGIFIVAGHFSASFSYNWHCFRSIYIDAK